MEEHATRSAILLRFYQRYLADTDTPRFIALVAEHYTCATLERLLSNGDIPSKRAAALALGLLGNRSSVKFLGPHLRSNDRKLRLISDDAMRGISAREGSTSERQQLDQIVRLNECGNFEQAVELANILLESSGGSAEAYHQRSLALFQLDEIEPAMQDCRQVLRANDYHYPAMVGLGHCHLELGDLLEALFWYRKALDVYPDLETVRLQVRKLEKAIQEL